MNSKVKAVFGFVREVATTVGITAAYVAVDQSVRTVVAEKLKKNFNKDKANK